MNKPFTIALALLSWLAAVPAEALNTKYFSRQNGTWDNKAQWSTVGCGGVRAADWPANGGGNTGDSVEICNGDNITVNQTLSTGINNASLAAIQVDAGGQLTMADNNSRTVTVTGAITNSGTFRFSGGAAHTLNATGGITNSGTFDVATGSNLTHVLNIGGNLVNNGTFDMSTDANSLVQVTFNRNGSATISGNGATTRFYRLIVSMGASAANVLDYQATNFQFSATPVGCLVLANGGLAIASATNCMNAATNPATGGTFSISSAGTITISPFNNAPMAASPSCYAVGSTAGFWLNSATTTVNVGNASAVCTAAATPLNLSLNGGLVRVSAGSLNLTTQPNQRVQLLNSATSTYWQEGGAVTINGRLASTVAGGSAIVQIDGGTLLLGVSATANNDASAANGFFGPFYLGNGASSQFIMSGGTIVIRNESTAATPALAYVNGASAANSNVTGGLLQIGDAATPASGQTFDVCVGSVTIVGGAPNCVSSGNAPVWNLTVDWNKNSIAQLQSALTVKNDLMIGSSSNNSSAKLNASTTANNDLTVGNNLTITGGTTLTANDRTISVGSGNVAGANGLWTNNGTFTAGTGTVTFNGTSATQSQAIAGSSATTFNNLTVNKSSSTTLTINTSPTVNGALTLTAGTVATGSNKLTVGTAGTVSRSGGVTPGAAGATNHVVGNVEKVFAAAGAFTYPLGDGTNYTPIAITMSAAGSLTATTASAPGADHPDTTAGRDGINSSASVNRYWTLKNATAAGSFTPTLYYVATDLDAGAPTHIARGESCVTTAGVRTCSPWGRLTGTVSSNSIAASSSFVLTTGAVAAETDLAAGQAATPRFAREKEFIYTRELY